MNRLIADTTPEAEKVLIELLRSLPPWRKLAQVGQMNATVRLLAAQGLRQRHPQADEAEIQRRLASILLGKEIARQVYGLLPKELAND